MRDEQAVRALLTEVCGASRVRRVERLQSLWSGWGEIARYAVAGPARADEQTVIVKRVQPPTRSRHPLGWASSTSDGRKRRSYEVEECFYRDFAPRLEGRARVARALHLEPGLFVLEDLDAAGFPGRRVGAGSLARRRIEGTIAWLAGLHATYLGVEPRGLWRVGTYWHLQTRPDELAEMAPGPLRDAAGALDAALSSARFQTLVHGDAKVANFCYGGAPDQVAAVDFQYVGGGVGVRDLAYFLGSCLGDAELDLEAEAWLDRYLVALRGFLERTDDPVETERIDQLEEEWRALWPLAWADFERFLAGWAPGHWKRSGFAARMTEVALGAL